MSERKSSLYVGSFLTSILGGIIPLISDFAGWYNYDAYNKVETRGWIYLSADSPGAAAILIIVALCLFYCTYISYLGLKSAGKLAQQNVRTGLLSAGTAFVIVLFSGLAFTVAMLSDEPTDWWLDTGFYAGFIGSGLTVLFFHLASKSNQ